MCQPKELRWDLEKTFCPPEKEKKDIKMRKQLMT